MVEDVPLKTRATDTPAMWDERPIFIVGAGRSGTTLLRTLLSTHSRIAIAPETHYMKRCDLEGAPQRDAPADFADFWKRYTASVRFKDNDIDADECLELIREWDDYTFRGVFAAVLTKYRERMNKARVGEKTPGHVFYLDRLLKWFPEARIIFIRRDPRAAIASQRKTPWNQAKLTPVSLRTGLFIDKRLHDIALRAGNWSAIYERHARRWESDPRVLTTTYESLVQDAEQELRRVCEFVGEPFEPAMLADRGETAIPTAEIPVENISKEWLVEHHVRTLAPVTTQSLEKWKNELSPMEVAIIESRCISGMRSAGYEPLTSMARRMRGRAVAKSLLAGGHVENRLRSVVQPNYGPAAGILFPTLSRA